MWETIVFYFPKWKVFLQAFIVLVIPYMTSSFFSWIRTLEKE
ncbi:hypothetical protein OF830_01410 [Bacillus paramycoides]|nr:hypothetical protein [Bacillus paramycoides]MCW9129647.1 hypothetical protein [Bacillus paramycoides]